MNSFLGSTDMVTMSKDPDKYCQSSSAMFLVSELSKSNNLQHQYKLVNEFGPAHDKVFTVSLCLSQQEEYTASGPSIKKAQQAAATLALDQTKLTMQPKSVHSKKSTPAVRFNSLALKLGLTPSYEYHNSPQLCQFNMDYCILVGMSEHSDEAQFDVPLPLTRSFYVTLKVSGQQFFGFGNSLSEAKQNAAEKGLQFLTDAYQTQLESHSSCRLRKIRRTSKVACAVDSENNDVIMKSPISLLHETAFCRNLTVFFQTVSETGPNHQKTFTLRCSLKSSFDVNGTESWSCEGEGMSKKQARLDACQRMLDILKQNDPLDTLKPPPRSCASKKLRRSKVVKLCADPNYGNQMNPVSRLIQIQQANGQPEPKFELVKEAGIGKSQEFVVQVVVGDKTCQGVGPNKKLAKRAAAEELLDRLGLNKLLPSPGKPVLKASSVSVNPEFVSPITAAIAVPPSDIDGTGTVEGQSTTCNNGRKVQFAAGTDESYNGDGVKMKSSRFARAHKVQIPPEVLHLPPKLQLEFLANSLGFDVQYTNFPKSDKRFGGSEEQSFLNSDYLSIVSLGRKLSQVSHGCGASEEIAENAAATAAMSSLGHTIKPKSSAS